MRWPPGSVTAIAAVALVAAGNVGSAQRPPDSASMMVNRAALQQVRRMPSLVDSTVDFARRVLSRLRLVDSITVRLTRDSSRDRRVVSQVPAPGAPIPVPGSTVQLVVHRYAPPRFVTVPDVRGDSLSEAVRALQGAGLVPRFGRQLRPRAATVADQSPGPGTRARPGDTITLRLDFGAVRVPGLVGLDVPTATQILARFGLSIAVQAPEYSDLVPPGRITRQHPDSGVLERPGASVNVWPSQGAHPPAPPMRMPDVRGGTLPEALQALNRLKLQLTHVDSVPDPARAGRIVDQRPQPGDTVHASDPVQLLLAVTVSMRGVPRLVGLRFETASALLSDSGFVARVQLVPVDTVDAGVVIGQDVAPGLPRPPRSEIGVTVSDTVTTPPPESRLMPGVVGLALDDASDSLGFLLPRLTVVEAPTSTRANHGRVTDQLPDSGEVVFPPVVVVLRVGRFEPPAPTPPAVADSAIVPNVVGRTLSEARFVLAGARLIPGDITMIDAAPDSVVASQIPTEGAVVAVGGSVQLTLQVSPVPLPPPSGLPWRIIIPVAAAAAAVAAGIARIWRANGDETDRRRGAGEVIATLEPLDPSAATAAAIDVPEDKSIVALDITLEHREPTTELIHHGSLVAREEVSYDRG
jgi:beta-lactam-binding protein with PASTA domain